MWRNRTSIVYWSKEEKIVSKWTAYTKFYRLSSCQELFKKWKKLDKKIVFTNGCFDILHVGHITLIEAARSMGDHLVLGLNSDTSVARLKGSSRPINSVEDRAKVLSALSFVDVVVVFEEETPLQLIERLLPHVLVKGGDYNPKTVVGAEVLKKTGGEVHIVPLLNGYSSSSYIESMQEKTSKEKKR